MIDRNRPVRFVGGHGRTSIFGAAGGGDLWVKHHDGNEWRRIKVTANGAPVHYPHDMRMPSIENYDIDWDRPIAFQDTGERGWLEHRTDDTAYVTDQTSSRFLFNIAGVSLKRDGNFEIASRDIMNVETGYTRQRDAKERIERLKEARAEMQQSPLWGMF